LEERSLARTLRGRVILRGMRPRELLAEARTPEGKPITLTVEGGATVVRIAGQVLMSSRVHGSEEAMAELACRPLAERSGVRVLVGGLGMGFTLRAALDALAADAQVVVSELLPCIAEWNRGPLAELAGRPLDDPRVHLMDGDFGAHVRAARAEYDAILADVDNGPEAFTVDANAQLYSARGIAAMRDALRPGGVLVVWSAQERRWFVRALRAAGLSAEAVSVRARGKIKKGSRHVLYVGRRGT
jgi:spermidine synthase